jgi:hypothetical protein
MLLSEPDTKGALFKAESILREAIAAANTKPHNAKSQATDAALSRQVACTDGLGGD